LTWSDGHNHYVLKRYGAGLVLIAFSGAPYRAPMIFTMHGLNPGRLVLRLHPNCDRLVVLKTRFARSADSGASIALHVTPAAARAISAAYGIRVRSSDASPSGATLRA
jgi:hypothetical protein